LGTSYEVREYELSEEATLARESQVRAAGSERTESGKGDEVFGL
jgi:hypothetical protein